MKAFLTLKDKVALAKFKNPVIMETAHPIEAPVIVIITDITKDWQLPLAGTKDINNPKIKEYSLAEFYEKFEILSNS